MRILSIFLLLLPAAIRCTAYAGTDTITTSGTETIWLHDDKATQLAHLARVWGFLKYHLPEATSGKVDMDEAFFQVLPKVLAAPHRDAAFIVISNWVDELRTDTTACSSCSVPEISGIIYHEPEYGPLFDGSLPAQLQRRLEAVKRSSYHNKKGKSHYVHAAPFIKNPVFANEREYAATPYPDAGLRLLSLFRYWNMVQYYCPNRHLTQNWDRALTDLIPDFCNAADTVAYQLACLKMITRINDTHGAFIVNDNAVEREKGGYITAVSAQFIKDKLVVTGYLKDTAGVCDVIKPGDVIEQIRGVSIMDMIRQYLKYTPASCYEEKLYRMAHGTGFLLRGSEQSVSLTILRNGSSKTVSVPCIAATHEVVRRQQGPDKGYRILKDNIGYLYPAKLTDKDLDVIKDSFAQTKGIIVDMRCYPAVFMPFTWGAWLKEEKSPFVKFARMDGRVPGTFVTDKPVSNGGGKQHHYKGKLVIIVNAATQSSAEYQTMALQSRPGTVVIGSHTSGADGNVSEIVLPGGIHTYISGLGVLYPDGTETQGKGVRIDREIYPTIEGISAGRDELLDEAINIINNP